MSDSENVTFDFTMRVDHDLFDNCLERGNTQQTANADIFFRLCSNLSL